MGGVPIYFIVNILHIKIMGNDYSNVKIIFILREYIWYIAILICFIVLLFTVSGISRTNKLKWKTKIVSKLKVILPNINDLINSEPKGFEDIIEKLSQNSVLFYIKYGIDKYNNQNNDLKYKYYTCFDTLNEIAESSEYVCSYGEAIDINKAVTLLTEVIIDCVNNINDSKDSSFLLNENIEKLKKIYACLEK